MTTRLSCAGDSLTRADFSVDYVSRLEGRHPPGDLVATRFGVNGDLAHDLLQRLDAVIATPADVICVLIGTNDARASLPGCDVGRVVARKQLPTTPSAAWFEECLERIVERLCAETGATVGLASLPVLGQDLDAPPARAAEAYSGLIRQVARWHRVAYVPVFERQREVLRRGSPAPVPYRDFGPAAFLGLTAQRTLLRRSLDTISQRRGLVLTTDHIHQNGAGADLIAEAIDVHLLGEHGPAGATPEGATG